MHIACANVGANLMSSWRDEKHRPDANAARLEQYFVVQAYHAPAGRPYIE